MKLMKLKLGKCSHCLPLRHSVDLAHRCGCTAQDAKARERRIRGKKAIAKVIVANRFRPARKENQTWAEKRKTFSRRTSGQWAKQVVEAGRATFIGRRGSHAINPSAGSEPNSPTEQAAQQGRRDGGQ